METKKLRKIHDYLSKIYYKIIFIEKDVLSKSDYKDLTVNELHIIDTIGLSGKKTSSDLARELQVTTGTVSVNVDKLIEKGYAERKRNPKDRRTYQILLTKKGRKLFRLHNRFLLNIVKGTLDDLDEGEVEIIVRGLKGLYNKLSEEKNV